MRESLEDRNLIDIHPLRPPRELKTQLPANEAAADTVLAARQAVRDVVHGADPRRLVVIAGPCSIHDPAAALDYARHLRRATRSLEGELVVIMRTYFEKPRTTVGWKGLLNDPHLDGSCDVPGGLELARSLLLEINELGVPCASEMLDPFTPQFLADLISWAAIGARTTESQTHRELASGLSMPVGFKNGTDGRIEVAHHAVIAARHPHSFLGITVGGASAVVNTKGNPDCHLVLRGGDAGPNYAAEHVKRAAALVREEDIARPILVDCSHGNSGKDSARQALVCREVLKQVRAGNRALMGLMLESSLHPGAQRWKPGAALDYGVSITDACIGWEETEQLLVEIAEAVKVSN
jgi:3-deoxy-7-phosphoheptulonate synthase